MPKEPAPPDLRGYGGGVPVDIQQRRGDAEVPIEDDIEAAVAVRIGDAAEEFLEGDFGKALQADIRDDVAKFLQAILESTDLTSPEVKELHFKARVADKALEYITSRINDGRGIRAQLGGADDDQR